MRALLADRLVLNGGTVRATLAVGSHTLLGVTIPTGTAIFRPCGGRRPPRPAAGAAIIVTRLRTLSYCA